MDKKIREIEKEVPTHSKAHKGLRQLEKMDHKRDKVCELGKKVKKLLPKKMK